MEKQNSIFDLFADALPDSFKEEMKAAEIAKEKGKKKERNVVKSKSKVKVENSNAKKSKPSAIPEIEVFLPVTVCYARIQQVFDIEDFDESDLIRTPIPKEDQKNAAVTAQNSDVSDVSEPSDVSDEAKTEHSQENSTVESSSTEESTEDVPVRVHAEAIRKLMERSFPELSKERTKIDYDKEKSLLVPVVFTGSKGAFKAPFDQLVCQSKFINKYGRYLFIAENGLFRLSVSPFGIMSVKLTQKEINTFEFESGVEGYLLKIPKIPTVLLCQVISFFRMVAKFTGTEAIANICYSGTEYYVDVPEQDVTVDEITHFNANTDNVVLQLHSHPCFPAYFSSKDDGDELRDGLYGVVSFSEKALRLRMSIAGVYRPIPDNILFEDAGWVNAFYTRYSFPERWLRQVNVV